MTDHAPLSPIADAERVDRRPIGLFWPGATADESYELNEIYYGEINRQRGTPLSKPEVTK